MTRTGFLVHTAAGPMRAVILDGRLLALDFAVEEATAGTPAADADRALLVQIEQQVDDWWAGRRAAFNLPLAPRGTVFQRGVWAAAQAIPRGSVATYGEIATRIGRPGAGRAVGAALGRNPWLLVVPCHRVVAADGSLSGYAGGLERKRAMLAAEGADTFSPASPAASTGLRRPRAAPPLAPRAGSPPRS